MEEPTYENPLLPMAKAVIVICVGVLAFSAWWMSEELGESRQEATEARATADKERSAISNNYAADESYESPCGDGQPCKAGDWVPVPGWEWVDAVNRKEHCGIKYKGSLDIKAVLGDQFLVEYMSPEFATGTSCTSGIQFLVSREWLESKKALFEEIALAKKANAELVARLQEMAE